MKPTKFNLLGPWLWMIPFPFALPFVVIVKILILIFSSREKPFAKFQYWLVSSVAGLLIYLAIDYYLGFLVRQSISG